MLDENDFLPDLELETDCSGVVRLSDYLGQNLVIYFYPKDDTSGCTLEAKAFTDYYARFKALNCEIVGISKDDIKKHQKFREKYSLLPILGTANDNKFLEEFGVWKEKSMYGKKYMGIERSSFLINKSGQIKKIWRKVKVPGHVEEVYKDLTEMM